MGNRLNQTDNKPIEYSKTIVKWSKLHYFDDILQYNIFL